MNPRGEPGFRIVKRKKIAGGGLWRRSLRFGATWLLLGLAAGIAAGALAGLLFARGLRLPSIEALGTFRAPSASQVRAQDGSALASFASQRRIALPAEQIPQVFRDAVVAVEDSSFYRHTGFNPTAIARALWRDILAGRAAEGGSTITQQLARTLFLTLEKTLERKIKELFLAIEIEQRLSKDQILTLYSNQVPFGHGTYGVEAAARFYFGKSASHLTLPEAATLAGVIQGLERLSPYVHPDRALNRRNFVLRRMREEGMIDAEACSAAQQTPLEAASRRDGGGAAAYFVEQVRRSIEESYGSQQMLQGGLVIDTTLDPALQALAEDALREGLVRLQRRLGWPGALRNVLADTEFDLESWRHPGWRRLQWRAGELVFAVVHEVSSEVLGLRIGERSAWLPHSGAAWIGRRDLAGLVRRGDVLLVRLEQVPADAALPVVVSLEAEPAVDGAIVVIDNRTGAVLAHAGGFDFHRSQWDRAVQARRQAGSAFKPLLYLAAFEKGFALTDLILDAPVLLADSQGLPRYCPLNYDRTFAGIVTLRHAVEESLNASAAKLQQLVGGEAVIDVARRFGITSALRPFPTLALGAFEVSLLELTAAYAGIANGGIVAEPTMISAVRDGSGLTLEENRPRAREAVAPEVAFMMTSAMEGVIDRGTGEAAAFLPGVLAGKTGTTDDYTDAWFIGFDPRMTCGVWVGRDRRRPIGHGMTGAEAALPIWAGFMEGYLATLDDSVVAAGFPVPLGVELVAVDLPSGMRPAPECHGEVIVEALPHRHRIEACTSFWQRVLALPWPQQLPYYAYRPGEPETTEEAIAAAARRLGAER